MSERTETLMRIIVCFISGMILHVWKALIGVFTLVNFVITLVTNKRNKELAQFSEIWNTQVYVFLRYITFVSNERPFPFVSLSKSISKFKRK